MISILRATRSRAILFSLAATTALVVAGFSYWREYKSAGRSAVETVALWEQELATGFEAHDWLSIRKIGRSIVSPLYASVAIYAEPNEIVFSHPASQPAVCQGSIVAPISRYGVTVGRMELCPSWSGILSSLTGSLGFILFLTLIGGVVATGAMLPLLRYRKALKDLLTTFESWSADPKNAIVPSLAGNDAADPINARIAALLKEGIEKRLEADRQIAETQRDRELAAMARQVSHDICSPLASLEMMLDQLSTVPEQTRSIVRSAVRHIREIANDLLDQAKEIEDLVGESVPTKKRASAKKDAEPSTSSKTTAPETRDTTSIEMIGCLVDSLMSQKRAEYRDSAELELHFDLGPAEYGLFAEVQPSDFTRVLSNLVNNAVSACDGTGRNGKVSIRLETEPGRILVLVEDNGRGMTPDFLAALMAGNSTRSSNSTGNGLGLAHARRCVDRWCGTLGIESWPGKGTMVRISLPTADAPSWFVSALELPPNGRIVALDDSESIHLTWDVLLARSLKASGCNLVHLTSAAGFCAWFANSGNANSTSLFLMDYELAGEEDTGLDLIEDFGLAGRAILVTGRHDEPAILKRCQQLGVKMIPKGLMGCVPVTANTPRDILHRIDMEPVK